MSTLKASLFSFYRCVFNAGVIALVDTVHVISFLNVRKHLCIKLQGTLSVMH